MKRTIRTICMLVLAVLACTIIPPTATAEQSNLISIADNIPAIPNGSTSVPVMLNNSTGVANVGIRISYNASVVNVTGAVMGDFTSYFAFDNTYFTDGYITINTFIMGKDLTGDVAVAYVTLKAVGDYGEYSTLNFSIISMSDQYGNDIGGTTDNGMFVLRSKCGDLNSDCALTSADAVIALRIAAGGSDLCDATMLTATDVSGDGKVTSLDALMIIQAAAGAISL